MSDFDDSTTETAETTTPLTLGKSTTETLGTATRDASFDEGPGPRIRWAGIIWGLIVSAIAVVVLAVTGSDFGRAEFLDWAASLTAGTVWLLVVLVAGALLLVLGLLALLRRRA
ncbi:hypothetical protein BH09ACT1_BH09ACT1_14140 [soil metagenome]